LTKSDIVINRLAVRGDREGNDKRKEERDFLFVIYVGLNNKITVQGINGHFFLFFFLYCPLLLILVAVAGVHFGLYSVKFKHALLQLLVVMKHN
jgi:hypothetical protein